MAIDPLGAYSDTVEIDVEVLDTCERIGSRLSIPSSVSSRLASQIGT